MRQVEPRWIVRAAVQHDDVAGGSVVEQRVLHAVVVEGLRRGVVVGVGAARDVWVDVEPDLGVVDPAEVGYPDALLTTCFFGGSRSSRELIGEEAGA